MTKLILYISFARDNISGSFEGAEIKPIKIDYVTEGMVRHALDIKGADGYEVNDNGDNSYSYNYTISGLDHAGLLDWQTIFDHVDNKGNSSQDVTIYALYPEANIYNPGKPVTHQGNEYNSLYELLSTTGIDLYKISGHQLYGYNEHRLDEIIVFDVRTFYDLRDHDISTNQSLPKPEFVMLTAIESKPLAVAIGKLGNVYIWTFILAVIGVVTIRKIIKRNLILPLQKISRDKQ